MKLPEPWTENCADLLRVFNKEGVEYLLIGSMAKSPLSLAGQRGRYGRAN